MSRGKKTRLLILTILLVGGSLFSAATGGTARAAPEGNARMDEDGGPTVTIDSTATDPTDPSVPTNVNPIPITITFSEAVTGFIIDDIAVGNGDAKDFFSVDEGKTYTINVDPINNGPVTVNVPADKATGTVSGIDNLESNEFSITFDDIPPTVNIDSTASNPTSESPIPVIFTFSETVKDFTVEDIDIGNGSTGKINGSEKTYTIEITPDGDGPVTVDVDPGKATDAAGNGNVAATQFSITYAAPPTSTPSNTLTPSVTKTSTRTPTPTVTPSASTHLVISEFRTRGPNGADDEFVEIYNPTGETVKIGKWTIKKSAGCSSSTSTLLTIASNTYLKPGQHFLATSKGASIVGKADLTFTAGIDDNGGLALFDRSGVIIDHVGMCSSTRFHEGDPLKPLTTGKSNQSYERGPGGDTACYDTNDNAVDFSPITPSYPQNMASKRVVCSGVSTVTPTKTGTQPTNTNTPSSSAHIVISEFRTRGPKGESDEFIEIYNPTSETVSIAGWTLRKSLGCGSSYSTLVVITYSPTTYLYSGQHYLVAAKNSSVNDDANQTFTAGIADNGGIALVNASGLIIDEVGMCSSTRFVEGKALEPLTGDSNQSYERKPGGNTSCYDTDNNYRDFALISPSYPQNKSSLRVACAGAVTPTVSPSATRTSSRTPTPRHTPYPGVVVINEFLPHPRSDWNGDGTSNVYDEYIEVINIGTTSVNLQGWELDDGEDEGSDAYSLPGVTLGPREIAYFFGSETGISLGDGGDTVRLLKPDGTIVDAYTYPVVGAADQSWCRLPDGDGVWGFVCRPTPGRPNTRIESVTVVPGAVPAAEEVYVCPLEDTIPSALRSAECDASGADIWSNSMEMLFWLPSRLKWGVFVK